MTDHTYSVLMDGRVIVTHTDTEGVHPVYAIMLMGNKLSRYMTDANKETISEALEEARKEMGLDGQGEGYEPVVPRYKDPYHAYCGACGCRIPLKIKARYCHKCGRAVKWE